jgi:hypothetical protein
MSTLRVEALEQPDGTAFVFNNKNLLINGGMNIWQRSTNATGITATGYYSVDRWKLGLGTLGTWSMARSTDVPSGQGFGYSLKIDCTTADASPAAGDFLELEQSFEGQNLQHIMKGSSSAKSTVLTFWVKSNKTGTYNVEWYDEDNTRHFSKSYTIDSANTWEKKTISIPPDVTGTWNNDNTRCSWISFWLAAGSNYTTGSSATSWASITQANRAPGQVNLADSTSNELYITGCQLEVGSTASGFEFEPYAMTYNKCVRYYYVIDFHLEGFLNWATNFMIANIHAPNGEFRDTPTSIVFFDTSGGGTWGSSAATKTGFRIYNSGVAGKVTKIKIDAEL